MLPRPSLRLQASLPSPLVGRVGKGKMKRDRGIKGEMSGGEEGDKKGLMEERAEGRRKMEGGRCGEMEGGRGSGGEKMVGKRGREGQGGVDEGKKELGEMVGSGGRWEGRWGLEGEDGRGERKTDRKMGKKRAGGSESGSNPGLQGGGAGEGPVFL